MTSKAEQILTSSLRMALSPLPDGASVPESAEFRTVLSALEYFVPEVLAEVYPEWKRESLDGVFPLLARKAGEGEIEILGVCIIISDQSRTAIHLRLQMAAERDEVSWFECRLGEAGEDGMVRVRWNSAKELHAVERRATTIKNWAYKVTFGQRREGH